MQYNIQLKVFEWQLTAVVFLILLQIHYVIIYYGGTSVKATLIYCKNLNNSVGSMKKLYLLSSQVTLHILMCWVVILEFLLCYYYATLFNWESWILSINIFRKSWNDDCVPEDANAGRPPKRWFLRWPGERHENPLVPIGRCPAVNVFRHKWFYSSLWCAEKIVRKTVILC